MNYLVVGLGNIGAEYAFTRHNMGFMTLDAYAEASNVSFSTERYGDVATVRLRGHCITLLKPSTYMNLSGKAVNYWKQKLNIPLENILVVLDDLALPFGFIRMRKKGSDGGHNGLKNIDFCLASNDYARMRLGIGNSFAPGAQVNFVLGKLIPEEMEQIPEIMKKAGDAINLFVLQGVDRAMNVVNTRQNPKPKPAAAPASEPAATLAQPEGQPAAAPGPSSNRKPTLKQRLKIWIQPKSDDK